MTGALQYDLVVLSADRKIEHTLRGLLEKRRH